METTGSHSLRRGVAVAALTGRKRPAAVQPPQVENCTISGTTTTVYDDRDNSGTASAGDVATITYTNCSDVAGEVTNGSIVAQGGFAMAITTPLYSDTITLLGGYTLDSAYDGAALPPGGTVAGRTTTTAHGPVESAAAAAAAGYVQVNALQPMVQYDVDPYPRSGQFEVVGKTGSLQAVVLSTAQVEIDLDADGNGVFEATKIVAWTDFF